MLPTILTLGGISLITSVLSDIFCESVQDKEQHKRTLMTLRAIKELRGMEYQKRGVWLDQLSNLQKCYWEEINLIRYHRNRIENQINELKNSKHGRIHFDAKRAGTSFLYALNVEKTDTIVKEHYYHSLIQKISKKKHELTSHELDTRKRLRGSYFEQPDYNEFAENLPIRGTVCEATHEGVKKGFHQLKFKNGFRALVDRTEVILAKPGWGKGKRSKVFVSKVDYKEGDVQIHPGLSALFAQLEKNDIEDLWLKAPASPQFKNNELKGYILNWRGVRIFLPKRFGPREISPDNLVQFRLVSEEFDPFNLIATTH